MIYILDTGVSFEPGPRILSVDEQSSYLNRFGLVSFKKVKGSVHPHGTVISRIIQNELTVGEEVYSIRILDQDLNGSYRVLMDSLKRIEKIGRKGVINLSLGLTNPEYFFEFHQMISRLLQKQIYIICAASRVRSYPSAFDHVISVSDRMMFENDRMEIHHPIDLVVDIDVKRHPFIPYSSTSFAAPFVTAKASELLKKNNVQSIQDLKRYLSFYFKKWEN